MLLLHIPLLHTHANIMNIQDAIKLIAGSFVLISVILGYFVNEYFFLFTVFVALNLIQSSFTKWCLMSEILKKLGLKNEVGCTI